MQHLLSGAYIIVLNRYHIMTCIIHVQGTIPKPGLQTLCQCTLPYYSGKFSLG